MSRKRSNTGEGFTLLEVLIVVGIIGILASMVLTGIYLARLRARDAERVANVRSTRDAMELFYSTNQRYPDNTDADCDWDVGNQADPADPFISELETSGVFSRTPREKTLFRDSPPCYGTTYMYKKFDAGSACNEGRPFAIFAVRFEKTHAELGFPNDDIDSCGCTFAADTCTDANRYGIMLKE